MNVIHKFGVLLVVTTCVLISAANSHAQEPELRANIVSISEGAYPNARAIVSIEDSGAAGDATFSVENFQITVDGAPAEIVTAELAGSEDAPLDLLLLFDTSGSMEGAPLASAKDAAKALIAELGANDRIALLHFGDEVALAQDFTADRALINGAIDALVAQGNTALYQATAAGSVAIAGSTATRRAVVLLSDGADFGGRSVATRDESIAAAAGIGVPFFAIAQGTDLDRPYLQQIAQVTSGRYLEAPRPEDLQALYVSIGRMLRSQYIVTFDASAALSAGSRVVVTVTDGAAQAVAESTFTPGAAFLPSISIEGLEAGESLNAPRDVVATVSNGSPRVSWYVDDVNVLETGAPPYIFTYDPAQFAEGEHTLRVAVGDGPSLVDESVAFRSTPPAVPASGGPPVVPIAGIAGVLLLVAGAVFIVRRRAPKGDAPIPAEQRTTSWAEQVAKKRVSASDVEEPLEQDMELAPEDIGQAMGLLISRSGSDLGSEYSVGGKPVSIGAGSRCGVRIKDPELASEEARIWVRGDHLMLHMFTRLTTVESGGVSGGWQILEPGDTFPIGQHTFEFRLLPSEQPAAAASETTGSDVPSILRDPEPERRPQPPPSRFKDLMPRAD